MAKKIISERDKDKLIEEMRCLLKEQNEVISKLSAALLIQHHINHVNKA